MSIHVTARCAGAASACVLASLTLTACDLISSAKSTIVVAGLMTATPDLQLAGQFEVPAETRVAVLLGEREGAKDVSNPDPLSGADIALEYAGNRVDLTELDNLDGFYVADSGSAPALTFADGQFYTFVVDIPNNDAGPFGGSVTAPTRVTPASLSFSPAPQAVPMVPDLYRHPRNTKLRVTWLLQNGRYGYVTVVRADPANPSTPMVVFDTRPTTTGDLIAFIVGTPETSAEIPAETFAEDGAYAVLVVVADKGEPKTNTFLGSPLLAGSGEKLLLAVGDFTP